VYVCRLFKDKQKELSRNSQVSELKCVNSAFTYVTKPALLPRDYILPGLPDFSWSKHTKMGKLYQMATNYTKRPQIIPKFSDNIPNGLKIFQMAIKYTKQFAFQGPPKFTQIGIFGLKINHLAALHFARVFSDKGLTCITQ
jgi:hypothetical protein